MPSDGFCIKFENATSLVKNSATSLTGKFLEICIESLGFEIGSDCFSSYPSPEILSCEAQLQQEIAAAILPADASLSSYRSNLKLPPLPGSISICSNLKLTAALAQIGRSPEELRWASASPRSEKVLFRRHSPFSRLRLAEND
nr:protein FAF-like, chloroplastic [Ipomoea batatas]